MNDQNKSKIFIVDFSGNEKRVDLWLKEKLQEISRSKIQDLIESKMILLNNKPCQTSTRLSPGDVIAIKKISHKNQDMLSPVKMNLDIIFEDEHLLVINKAAGLSVHPGAGKASETTLVNGIIYHTQGQLSTVNKSENGNRPGIVHRLDKDTTGLIVCAKSNKVHENLAKQFRLKTSQREYIALIDGEMKMKTQNCESYLSRDPNNRLRYTSFSNQELLCKYKEKQAFPKKYRLAKTKIEKVCIYAGRFTLIKATLETGRTHQIRVHTAKIMGFPILGDPLYSVKKTLPKIFNKDLAMKIKRINRQLLHAQKLSFYHPIKQELLTFTCPLPKDFKSILDILEPLKQGGKC